MSDAHIYQHTYRKGSDGAGGRNRRDRGGTDLKGGKGACGEGRLGWEVTDTTTSIYHSKYTLISSSNTNSFSYLPAGVSLHSER